MRFYILQILYKDEDVTIKNVKVTNSKSEAEKWYKKQPKNYWHGYQEIDW